MPRRHGKLARDHDGAGLVPPADDVEEEIRGAAVARDVPELVEHQEVWRRVAAEAPLSRWDRLLPEEIGEGGGQCAESDGVPALESAEAEILRERGLANPGLTS